VWFPPLCNRPPLSPFTSDVQRIDGSDEYMQDSSIGIGLFFLLLVPRNLAPFFFFSSQPLSHFFSNPRVANSSRNGSSGPPPFSSAAVFQMDELPPFLFFGSFFPFSLVVAALLAIPPEDALRFLPNAPSPFASLAASILLFYSRTLLFQIHELFMPEETVDFLCAAAVSPFLSVPCLFFPRPREKGSRKGISTTSSKGILFPFQIPSPILCHDQHPPFLPARSQSGKSASLRLDAFLRPCSSFLFYACLE